MGQKWFDKFDFWIFESYKMPSEYLALCRISYALFNLFFLFHFNFSWISEYPESFYHPKPGLTYFFNDFPSIGLFYGLNIGLGVLNFLLLLGYRTKWVSILVSLFLIISFSFVFGFGNTYHVVMWILFPGVMTFSNWGSKISLDARNENINKAEFWPITLMSILIGFAFFTSGFAKLMGGWLNTSNSASWQYFHIVRSKVGRDLYLSEYVASIHNSVFWEVSDWLVVGLEIGILFAVFWPRMFRWFISFAVFFHFINVLMLNISFSIHLAIFMVFINWNNMKTIKNIYIDKLLDVIDLWIGKLNVITILLMIIIYLVLFYTYEEHSRVDRLVFIEYFVYLLGIIICSSFLFYEIKGILLGLYRKKKQ